MDVTQEVVKSELKMNIGPMPKITFCIPSKNNKRYLQWCIASIRKNAWRKDHDIIVFVDANNDGTIEWLEANKETLNLRYLINPNLGTSLYGIGRAYDACVSEARTDICMIFHADMYLCPNADMLMYTWLQPDTVVCATRIEPPLHPEGREKIVMNFGLWPESDVPDGFREQELLDFAAQILNNQPNPSVTRGCFAPWMIYADRMMEIGGHDPLLKSAREDSDIFNRFVLHNLKLVQTRVGFVYHLTCRGGQFEHGNLSTDHNQKSEEWKKLMEQSTIDYLRKWGCLVQHDEYMHPIIKPKYDIGMFIRRCPPDFGKFVEPWVSCLYLDDEEVVKALIEHLQPTSGYDMSTRIKYSKLAPNVDHDVLIITDGDKITNDMVRHITMLPLILAQDGTEPGLFAIETMTFDIRRTTNHVTELVHIDNPLFV